MIRAQCLVAFLNSISGAPHAYTSPITSYYRRLHEGNLSFGVLSMAAQFENDDNEMIIYATVDLPEGTTNFTHLWKHDEINADSIFQMHPTTPDHLKSYGTIDFAKGSFIDIGSTSRESIQLKRNVHGILNLVSWGIMMPLGVMTARYLKVFKAANSAWFYLHVICQSPTYIVGIAGWVTGLKFESDSTGAEHTTHKNIGSTLFSLATLQIFEMLLRPKSEHKYRVYWNMYHQSVGYTVVALNIVNIFKGLDVLIPGMKWKNIYIWVY